jgi:bifunctional non-homologous end joining protein LigD
VAKTRSPFPVSDPDRLVYPNNRFTHGDVIDYYVRIAPYLLPHLKDRPVTLKRYPDDVAGPFYYEKDAPAFTPKWVRTFGVWRRSGDAKLHYIVINDLRTLAWAAEVGTLEIHPFLAREPNIEQPTLIVFDLDPGEGANILNCARVALLLRDFVERLGLQSFAKVSGVKGIQVYIPLNTPITYAITQPFAKTVAEWLHREHPDQIVSEMERAQRKAKVFIDWRQNADYKTTIAVYSLRSKRYRPHVSLPVTWDELEEAIDSGDSHSLYWYAAAALERVDRLGDLFAPVVTLRQTLPEAFVRELQANSSALVKPATSHRRRAENEPRAGAQGGRRRFVLAENERGTELRMEMHDAIKIWALPEGLPSAKATRAIRTADSSAQLPRDLSKVPGALDFGTVEVVSGSEAKGKLHLYFTGSKLAGDWKLSRSAPQDKLWTFSRSDATGTVPGSKPAQAAVRHTRPKRAAGR